MAITERDRALMMRAFERSWGEEVAMIVADHLPTGGWPPDVARRQDVDAMRQELYAFEARAEDRFEAFDRRFEAVDRRFEAVDRRFEEVEERIDLRFGVLDERITALDTGIDLRLSSFKHELFSEIDRRFTDQTRTIVVSMIGMLTAFAGVIVAAVSLGRP